jgi:hypothetical protein
VSALSVVLPVSPTYDGLPVGNRVVSVPAGVGPANPVPGVALIPVPDSVYGPGTQAVQYSVTANISVAAVRVP